MRPARELLAAATARLAAASIDTPRVDAELLLAELLGVPRTRLRTLERVPDSVARRYDDHLTRRARREPLQHITGTAAFRYLELAVGPGVFVPRPETELLIDAVLPHLRAGTAPIVVDLCAGSGAIALAIATEVPGAQVLAVEASMRAGRWLARNVADTDVRVLIGDIRDPDLLRELYGRVAAVVSNPPYVPSGADVSAEVLADPREAVFAGPDGLELIPSVIARAALLLRPGGMLAIEHDDSHGQAVPGLLSAAGDWTDIIEHPDLSGRARFATACRVGSLR